MRANGWKPETNTAMTQPKMATTGNVETENTNLGELANDQIAKLISTSLKAMP
jgi:hypothetical protein